MSHFALRALTPALLCCSALLAQTASISGTVLDSSGAGVPGASITAENTATGLKIVREPGTDGSFSFIQLPVGPYDLRVNASGFQPFVRTGIVLVVDQATNVPVHLTIGPSSETVTVSANVEMVNVSSPMLSQVIEEARIEELPLNGRNPAGLIFLTAGVADAARVVGGVSPVLQSTNSYPDSTTVAANGTRGGGSNFSLDGVLNMDNYQMTAPPLPDPDATQEFNVGASTFSARYGFASGGVVNTITRSGTNLIHGLIFEYMRNGALNARDFFAPPHDNLKRDQFGGTFGGPIVHDKLFVFASYQGTGIRNLTEGLQRTVPTSAMRTGNFSALLPRTVVRDPVTKTPYPGNIIPANAFSPAAVNLLKLIPDSPTGNLVMNLPSHTSDDQGTLKLDWNAGTDSPA